MSSESGTMTVEKGYKVTEVGVIPEEWEVKALGELGDWYGGGTPSKAKAKYWTNGTICWISSQDVKQKYVLNSDKLITAVAVNESSSKLTKPNSLIMVMRSGILRHTFPVGITPRPVAINQDIKALTLFPGISTEYVYAYLKLRNKDIVMNLVKAGTTVESVEYNQLKQYPIPLPPLLEQEKIAEVLSTVDEHIGETEDLIEKTEILKKGMMQRLLTRGIGHTKFKDTEIGHIPAAWEVAALGAVTLGKPMYGENVPAVDYDESLPRYVRITDIRDDGRLRDDDIKSFFSGTNSKCKLAEGDLCFARSGATVGKTYLYNPCDGDCVFAGYLIKFVPDSTRILPEYLFAFTHSYQYYAWVSRNLRQGAQPNINAQEYSSLVFPLPPLPEQREIADILTAIDDRIEEHRSKLEALTRLKSGLMQQLLTGRIRVKL